MTEPHLDPPELGDTNVSDEQHKAAERALIEEAQNNRFNQQQEDMSAALANHWTRVKRPAPRKWQTEEDNNPASAEEQEKYGD